MRRLKGKRIPFKKFNPDYPVYARKRIHTQGKRYQPGDLFDLDHFNLSKRQLRLMFDNGRLTQDLLGPTLAELKTPVEIVTKQVDPTVLTVLVKALQLQKEKKTIRLQHNLNSLKSIVAIKEALSEVPTPVVESNTDETNTTKKKRGRPKKKNS